MTKSQKNAAARIFYNKLRALGLPHAAAVNCTGESLAWYARRARQGHDDKFFFRLRRAEYCAWRHASNQRKTRRIAA